MRKVHQRSFAGGEIAEEMLGRFDLNHYQIGVKKALNFYSLPHGPMLNRQGLESIKESRNGGPTAVRVIPFIFDETQAYALEFSDTKLRIHTEGATVLETNTNISGATQASPCVITDTAHGYSDGDEVYIDGIVGMEELNGRFFLVANKTTNTFELTDLQGNNIDSSSYTAYTSGGTAGRVYEATHPYAAADLFEIKYVQSEDVMTLTHPDYQDQELRRVAATTWTFSNITYGPSIAVPSGVGVVASPSSGTTVHKYVVVAISESILEPSLASAEVSATNDLTVSGNLNTISWSAVTGATRYNVYKEDNGLFGYIGQTVDLSFVDDNITPDLLQTPPEDRQPFSGSGNYPASVSYFNQRRVFGGSNDDPKKIEMMKPGTESNTSKTIPQQDDDAITVRLKSLQNSKIRHMVPLDSLLVFTSREEFKLFSVDGAGLTPTTVDAKSQSSIGCSHLRPIVQGDAVLFNANVGSHIYDMQFTLNTENTSGKFKPRDISIIAPHLVEGFTLVDWAHSREPYSMIFAPRSDGKFVGLTYLSDQQPNVLGFHLHDTLNGKIESVCAIPESNGEEMFYFVVQRRINGTDRRFIERLHTRKFNQVQDAFFVDAGRTYDDPKTITGITAANPIVVTAANHGFSNGDTVQIEDVDTGENSEIDSSTGNRTTWGMGEVNGKRYTVADATTNTFTLKDTDTTPAYVDGSSYTAYRSGGVVRKEKTVITNAYHLEGETVSIFADGNVHPPRVVTNGQFTLEYPAARVHYGLAITADLETLPLVFSNLEGFGTGDFKSVTRAFVRVNRTRTLEAGPDADHLKKKGFRTDEAMGTPTRLRSEELALAISPDLDRSGTIYLRTSDPAPCSIVSIGAEVA